MTQTLRSITLYCTEGSSDKEYQLTLEECAAGFIVNFAYGRRGSALKTGTKTNSPVAFQKAVDIYDKLLKEKTGKGYTEAESGARYVGTDLEERDSGLSPMLPSPITRGELANVLADPAWAVQEKFDGENRLVVIDAVGLRGVNRRGLFCSMRSEWIEDAPFSAQRTIIAGEDMGDHFVAFDIVEHEGERVGDLSLRDRQARLGTVVSYVSWMRHAETAYDAESKKAMLARIEAEGGEGVVAKRIAAAYAGGRSLDHLKMKFQESSTFEVIRVNDQRSVGLGLYADDGTIEDLGNVTIPANHDVPAVGDFCEVEYMMRYEGGALMQPKYKGRRTDIDGKPSIDQITRVKTKQAA